MQQWIIAMLIISALLIIRDMAKTVFSSKNSDGTKELLENHPQKERIEKYAASFQKLADTFNEMPFKKESLTNQEIEGIFQDVCTNICDKCQRNMICWGQQQYQTYRKSYELLRMIEDGEPEKIKSVQAEWADICINAPRFTEELKKLFYKARQNLIWNNRLIENRMAVAQQLGEMANIMNMVAADLYNMEEPDDRFYQAAEKALRKRHLLLKNAWCMEKEEREQYFLTIRARSGQCVPVSEVAAILSKVVGKKMIGVNENRNLIKGEFSTILFKEDVTYKVSYGVARITKEKEMVSGDNFVCSTREDGRFVMCLSDGMGSGLAASQESEAVVELLEQFLNSGFSREAAAKMINSALLTQQRNGIYTTVDICTLDLYTGICEFLKAGAATTFIKRANWVESITSTSLAIGLVQKVDYETTSKNVEDGEYLIMVTDGVLDALPLQKEEETMKEILMQAKRKNPKELGKEVLERVLAYSNYRALDDMTVIVAEIGKK